MSTPYLDEVTSEGNDEREVNVTFINRAQNFALLDTGFIVPVIHWFNTDGDDCNSKEAVVCVCGSEQFGWFIIDLTTFDYMTVH